MTPKFSLTVNTSDAGEIARILAVLGGSVAVNLNDDDDAPAAPGHVAPERDATGLPWDARIHAKSKATKADGTWKSARGVDAGTVAAVEAELRALIAPPMPTAQAAPVLNVPQMQAAPVMQQPVQPAPVMQQPVQPAPVMQQPVQPAPVLNVPQMQAAPVMQQPAVQPMQAAPVMQQPAVQPQHDFNSFMLGLQKGMAAGLVDLNVLNAVVAQVNAQCGTQFGQITDLASRPDAIPVAIAVLAQNGKWVE